MSLYGKDDSNANKTKAGIGIAASSQAKETIFVDNDEAALAENKARGFNAPGWWSYYTFTDADGNTRHKAEMLVSIADPEANADETQTDDAIAADRTIILTSQPALEDAISPGQEARIAIAAELEGADGGSINATWYVSTNNGSNWTPVYTGSPTNFGSNYMYQGTNTGGFSGATLVFTSSAGMTNYQYRVVLSAAGASATVTSDEFTLTFS